ncbi:phenylacetate--CoA ligase family protein [Arabiibacter massiliensis]|uniref:phenylacetate--CoA ligase family protein n=1 Tax=Arabiibacter massiliensis TaxID=1870985 RepID=UPI0009BC1790|nr:phenylacetate--CoA ligase family protein [Arabiibacter massiliensis]
MGMMEIYGKLPVFAQNMAFSFMGSRIQKTRYGRGFEVMLNEFESHDDWSADRVAEWRNGKLKNIVAHAYRTVPFYRESMDEAGVNPASIKTAEDLKRLPVIDKSTVRSQPRRFVSSEAGKMNLLRVHTSGTTGSSFMFDSTVECQQAQFACFWRCYRKHGLSFDTWQAQFSSKNIVPVDSTKPPFWRVDRSGRRFYMSAFHESPGNLGAYFQLVNEKRFKWISGYPSLMSLLAQWMNERGLQFDFVKTVTCGAESLLDHQSAAMEKAFGVKPIQTYGQTENVAIFSTRPDGRILVDEDFSIVEFEQAEGGGCSILGTCLFNYATPLIRYRTGDAAHLGTSNGFWREIMSIDGRREDYLVLPDGTRVGKLDHVFKDTLHFQEAQVYQRADYSIVLRVVGKQEFCAEDEKIALDRLRKSVGNSLPVNFEYLSRIPRQPSGKLRFVLSEVPGARPFEPEMPLTPTERGKEQR